jgi:chromosomal replication initiator protein
MKSETGNLPPDAGKLAAQWARMRARLRDEVGETEYRNWLRQMVLQTVEGEIVLITLPSRFLRDWVRDHYGDRLRILAQAEWPQVKRMDFRVSTAAQATPDTVRADAQQEVEFSMAGEPSGVPAARSNIPAPPRQAEARDGDWMAPLDQRLTFDSFVVGPANEFALAVAKRVASWSDGHFNPVLIHGPYGFGKTHQLNAMAWEAMRTAPDKRVIYLTAERFLSTFVRAVMDKQTAAFKEELRAADLLLIDDVHFVGGKQSTQEELFHTLTALMEDGRRVVFSSDRAPAALDEIDARLRSHLQAGLVCGIEPADRILRLGILEKKLDLLGRQQGLIGASARPEVLQFLADRFTESVRELEGALNTLVARVGEGVSRLTLDEAQAILRPHLRGGEKRITIDDIQKATSEHFGLKQVDLISERRNRSIARPRQAAMWLAKQLTTRSLPDIGRRFGGRDHTTVLHAVRRIEALRAEDPQLSRDLEALTRKLRG